MMNILIVIILLILIQATIIISGIIVIITPAYRVRELAVMNFDIHTHAHAQDSVYSLFRAMLIRCNGSVKQQERCKESIHFHNIQQCTVACCVDAF